MGMKDVMRYWTKKTNQLIRQKKYIDKEKALRLKDDISRM